MKTSGLKRRLSTTEVFDVDVDQTELLTIPILTVFYWSKSTILTFFYWSTSTTDVFNWSTYWSTSTSSKTSGWRWSTLGVDRRRPFGLTFSSRPFCAPTEYQLFCICLVGMKRAPTEQRKWKSRWEYKGLCIVIYRWFSCLCRISLNSRTNPSK